MKNHSLFLFSIIFLLSINYYIVSDQARLRQDSDGQVQSANSMSKTNNVSAFVGGRCRFSIFGYTSPQALVTLEGTSLYDQTYADGKGFFQFINRFCPVSSRETCLTAQDQFGRLSQPTCLSPFSTDYNASIGPIILPPTLSLDKSDYYIGDEVVLSGQTIPNSEVDLSMFTKDTSFNFALIPPVEAFTIPKLQTKADKKGNFSISLPSSQSKNFRLFAQTSYDQSPSALSTTLNLDILPIWMIILKILWLIFQFLKPKLIEITIIIELIVLLLYILRRYFQPHVIARNKSLTLRENLALLDEEKTLEIRERYPLKINF